jgi:hypothetical protein
VSWRFTGTAEQTMGWPRGVRIRFRFTQGLRYRLTHGKRSGGNDGSIEVLRSATSLVWFIDGRTLSPGLAPLYSVAWQGTKIAWEFHSHIVLPTITHQSGPEAHRISTRHGRSIIAERERQMRTDRSASLALIGWYAQVKKSVQPSIQY